MTQNMGTPRHLSLIQSSNFFASLQATPKGTTNMTTKTKSPDSQVEYFTYRVELSITPALPDATVAGFSNQFLKLKQSKIEDVRWDPTAKGGAGDLVIINERASVVSAEHPANDMQYGEYKPLKQGVKDLATLATGAGVELNGYVLVWHHNHTRPFRILVTKNKVEVQAAAMAWPDGTTTPYPEYDANDPFII